MTTLYSRFMGAILLSFCNLLRTVWGAQWTPARR